jgi:hypothetical protein
MTTFATQEIKFADEAVFNEQLTTWDYRIPVLAVRPTFPQMRDTDRSLQNRLFKSRPGYLTSRSLARLEIDFYLGGAQVDTASGALSEKWHYKLLADALGGGNLSQVGGDAGASATATALTNATGTRVRGGIVRVGQAGDGRAQGQATVIGNPDTSLLVALPAAPNATDVVRACMMAYLTEALGESKRFLVAHSDTTGMQHVFSGCHAERVDIRVVMGDLPVVTIAYLCAYHREETISTPSADTLQNCDATISGSGSVFIANVGTTTRPADAEDKSSEFTISLNLQLIPQLGQNNGALRHAHVIGFVRGKDPTAPAGIVQIRRPWATAPITDFDADGSNSTFKHLLHNLSAGGGTAASEGRHVSLYAPRMYRVGERPGPTDWSNLNYITETFALDEGPDETNDLTRSAFRLGLS